MSLQKQFYFTTPVEVVKVTSHNLTEVAEWCGGEVATTESRKVAGRMDSYVWVPTPTGTKISWAFPGMFITKRLVRTITDELRVTYAVYRKDYFHKNYFESPNIAVDETWERQAKEAAKAEKTAPKPHAPKNKLKGTSMEQYAKDDVDFRDAKSGEFVTEEYAVENPDTTVKETTPVEDIQLPEVDPIQEQVEQTLEVEEKLLKDVE